VIRVLKIIYYNAKAQTVFISEFRAAWSSLYKFQRRRLHNRYHTNKIGMRHHIHYLGYSIRTVYQVRRDPTSRHIISSIYRLILEASRIYLPPFQGSKYRPYNHNSSSGSLQMTCGQSFMISSRFTLAPNRSWPKLHRTRIPSVIKSVREA
jgi:hypothetical protein